MVFRSGFELFEPRGSQADTEGKRKPILELIVACLLNTNQTNTQSPKVSPHVCLCWLVIIVRCIENPRFTVYLLACTRRKPADCANKST